MTTVGHSLAGLSIAALALPRGHSITWYLLVGHVFVLFANIPDLPIPGWGHSQYEISHSIFVTVLLAMPLWMLRLVPGFDEKVGTRVLVLWSMTWLSHMVLDSLYSHGNGIGIFWPVSDAHLSMPVPWFDTLTWPPFTEHNRQVFLTELGFYGSVLALCLLFRRLRHDTARQADVARRP
jgi:hypothetical protein